jgi:hypothetical protein
MQRISVLFVSSFAVLGLALAWSSLLVAEQAAAEAKPSAYAPAKDLRAQVDTLVTDLDADLAAESDYDEDHQARVKKNSATLAAVTLVLGLHDEENDLKKNAPAIVPAAKKLSDSAAKFKDAKPALDELKKALSAGGEGKPLKWAPVADVAMLMKAVPIVNNNLRRNVEGRRFAQSLDKSAALASTLAAIAQAAASDTTYCDGKEAEALWMTTSYEMRDAAASVQTAVRKGDVEASKEALARVVKTCDACHHKFRDK